MTAPYHLYSLCTELAEVRPQADAILAPGKKCLSYAGLARQLRSTALQLTRLGFQPGERIGLVLPNGPEMATAFLGISSISTCAPLNPACKAREFEASLASLRVKALVTQPGCSTQAIEAAEGLGIPIIQLLPDPETAGVFELGGLPLSSEAVTEPAISVSEEVALVLQTSGTTSKPKTVPITHRNIFHSVQNIISTYMLTAKDRCLNMMPLFHVHGLIAAVSATLASGGSVVCAPGFKPDQATAWFEEYGPTWYTAVPSMHQSILELVGKQSDFKTKVHLRFIRSCSAPLAPQAARELETVLAAPLLEAYGMTEATHQIASNPLPPRPHKFGSVGVVCGTSQVAILDEEGKALTANQTGEICIRGENVMGGYENDLAANQTTFIHGWLRTGDLGLMDEDGYIFIRGRLKELINRGGEKIAPREIDEVLLRHPAVRQAVCFAVPHPSLGEDIGAAIVLREGRTASVQELRMFAAGSLANFKVPRQIVFVNEIPKGPTGKIQRIGLAEKLKDELEASRRTIEKSSACTAFELELLSIWQGVMGNPQICVTDDFLTLGGDSIQAARILSQVNERYGCNLQIVDIFNYSTVTSMARLIQTQKEGR